MDASMYGRSLSYGANTATADVRSLRRRFVARRAYEIWRGNGCPNGTALQDWLDAERELNAELEMKRFAYLCRIRVPADMFPH